MYDAVIIGSGPNGLAAAVTLAQNGYTVKVFEAADSIGGGTRTQELTLPGFQHDVCSAIHPMAVGSPFFKTLPLGDYGLEWIYPEYPLAHPFDHEPSVVLQPSLDEMAIELAEDFEPYQRLFSVIVERWDDLAPELLSPMNGIPAHPILLSKFGLKALKSAQKLAKNQFYTKRTQALFAGLAAHSIMPLNKMATSAIGLVLGAIGHKIGWPMPRGGSYAIATALADYFRSLGGEIETNSEINDLGELPEADVVLFNNTPKQILAIAGDALPASYVKKLRSFKYGPGVFKMDMALDEPIPWNDERCSKAGTVHVGGTLEQIASGERLIARGKHPNYPFVLVAQQSLFDNTRAPDDKHTAWAYCHVPNGSTQDMSEVILNQIERFAPGFRDCIIETHAMNTKALESYNANYVGGDVNGGRQDITQLFTRPAGLLDPYHIPATHLFICSSSTPPGGGVHGMCGYNATRSAIKYLEK